MSLNETIKYGSVLRKGWATRLVDWGIGHIPGVKLDIGCHP
jgi:hypothetical protein